MKKKLFKQTLMYATLAIFALVVFTGCANVTSVEACTLGIEPYGFWNGFWHGMIAPISFFGSLFSDDIAMYAINNNGGWYDAGFVLGAGILTGGATIKTRN